jgi:hypothetical protein
MDPIVSAILIYGSYWIAIAVRYYFPKYTKSGFVWLMIGGCFFEIFALIFATEIWNKFFK